MAQSTIVGQENDRVSQLNAFHSSGVWAARAAGWASKRQSLFDMLSPEAFRRPVLRLWEARDAAKLLREKRPAVARDMERKLYRGSLPLPPREREQPDGSAICFDAAPSYGKGYQHDDDSRRGVRYPLISDFNSKAALCQLIKWPGVRAEEAEELAFVAELLQRSRGFQRVDPYKARRDREARRVRRRDHLERDANGRSLVQPPPLADFLRDFPNPAHHEAARFVHRIITALCADRPSKPTALTWLLETPAEQRPTACWVFMTGTPKRRVAGGRLTMLAQVEQILQHGWREHVPPYKREGSASKDAKVAEADLSVVEWSEMVTRLLRPLPNLTRSAKAPPAVFRAYALRKTA